MLVSVKYPSVNFFLNSCNFELKTSSFADYPHTLFSKHSSKLDSSSELILHHHFHFFLFISGFDLLFPGMLLFDIISFPDILQIFFYSFSYNFV